MKPLRAFGRYSQPEEVALERVLGRALSKATSFWLLPRKAGYLNVATIADELAVWVVVQVAHTDPVT